MSNVMTSFLVGIGWETSDFDKGTREIDRSLQGVKVSTLGVAAAILGVFGSVAAAAVNTAQRVDQLSLTTQNLNTNKQFVSNLGGALKLMGGNAADALDEVKGIEEALTNFKLKGELGKFADLPLAGLDATQITNLTSSTSAEGFLSKLAEIIPTRTNNQKQLIQQSLGLSDGTMKALSGGSQAFDALLQRSQDLTGTIGQLTENSRALSDQMAEFGLRMEGITNELAEKTLPGLVGLSKWANKFVEDHRAEISGVIDTVAENPGSTTALGLGAVSTVVGSLLTKFGLGTIGGIASKGGAYGMAVGGATIGTDVLFDTLESHYPGLKGFEDNVDDTARKYGLGKLVDFSHWLFNDNSAPAAIDRTNYSPGSSGANTPVDPMSYSPGAMSTPYKEVEPADGASNDTLVKAIQAAKINVANQINLNVSLDGNALESKITEVQERSNYSTIDDVRSSTAR